MRNASFLILLLPLLMTGANTGSSTPCNCGSEDTVKLKNIIYARVDSMVSQKVTMLEALKKDLLDSTRPLWLGHVDMIPMLNGQYQLHRWYYSIKDADTSFVRRTVTIVK